jgi:sodium/bile acid cotransporter 7
MAGRAGLDWFLLALLSMIGLAYLWPTPGIQEGPFSLSNLANLGVSVIYLFLRTAAQWRQTARGAQQLETSPHDPPDHVCRVSAGEFWPD